MSTHRLSTKIRCPRCDTLVNSSARFCEFCGVDLAIAAALAERELAAASESRIEAPATLEILVPRLGQYLVDKQVISDDELGLALEYQQKMAAEGRQRLLGQAILDLELIDRDILDRAITEQVFALQHALQRANRQLERRVQERTAELQDALVRLSELNQLKSNFISNISHELRTPLTHIRGYSELILDGTFGSLTQDQKHALDVVLRSSHKLQQLIEDLLQFSLAVQGELSLQLEHVSLRAVIESVVLQYRSRALAKDINLESLLPDKPLIVQADEEKLAWVLQQLVDNAIKFTPAGGLIRIAVQLENQLATAAVIDSGIGIPEQRVDELFEVFHQLDGSMTRQYGGIGLGLAYANRILEAHGSKLQVSSKVGKGSRFEFSIPLAENQETIQAEIATKPLRS